MRSVAGAIPQASASWPMVRHSKPTCEAMVLMLESVVRSLNGDDYRRGPGDKSR